MSNKQKISVVLIVIISLVIIFYYYLDVNNGFIPPINTVEGTFVMSVSDDMGTNYVNGVYIVFSNGEYMMYQTDRGLVIEKGKYELIDTGVYQIDEQSIVLSHNSFYMHSESFDSIVQFIRFSKVPSDINVAPEDKLN